MAPPYCVEDIHKPARCCNKCFHNGDAIEGTWVNYVDSGESKLMYVDVIESECLGYKCGSVYIQHCGSSLSLSSMASIHIIVNSGDPVRALK